MNKIAADPRLDPRLKLLFGAMELPHGGDVESREAMIEQANSPEATAAREALTAFFAACDTEEVAPSAGLTIQDYDFVSEPDGNTAKIQFIRPDSPEPLPCVYYIHGGGMAAMSCYDGNYRAWGKIIAARGVAVAMVDFRNSVSPSSVPEVAPYPAGLNDCVSGLKWVLSRGDELGIDTGRVIVAGESGGGSLILSHRRRRRLLFHR